MPKIAPERSNARREQILTAARKCFAKKGFHSTSMQDIYIEAGVSAGLIYRYFSSKQKLIFDLVKQSDRQVIDLLKSRSSAEDPREALVFVFGTVIDWVLEEPISELKLGIHFWAETALDADVRKTEAQRLKQFAEALVPLVEECQSQGDIAAHLCPRAVGQLVLTNIQGLIVHRVANPRGDFAALKKAMLSIFQDTFIRSGKNGQSIE